MSIGVPIPPFRLLSIDPGSNMTGFSILDYDIDNDIINVVFSTTVTRKDVLAGKGREVELYGERPIRLMGYATFLDEYVKFYGVSAIISEAPFLSRMPQAFKVLSELTSAFNHVAITNAVNFHLIDPPNVKKAVGVHGRSSDKEDMRRALQALPNLVLQNGIALANLDEHAIDSICVGIWFINEALKNKMV